MLRSRVPLAIAFAIAILLVPPVWCQENATITGTVLDPSGAVVPNIAITLTNPATAQLRQTVSNSAGVYQFANVELATLPWKLPRQASRNTSRPTSS